MVNAANLPLLLKELRLSTMCAVYKDMLQHAEKKNWSYERFLAELCEQELNARYTKRIQRNIKASKIPSGKTLEVFDFKHAKSVNKAQVQALAENTSWVEQSNNVLIFGPSGVGKSHLAAAIGYAQIDMNKRVLMTSTTALVQNLQRDKKNYQLPECLSKLDKYDLLILDDIGYVKKDEGETSVLFELIHHRYESGSLIITANQPFSQWDKIFPDNMMAVAAIDRLIHHATIIKIDEKSYRKTQSILKK
jgi:DNA replication protein DnaC